MNQKIKHGYTLRPLTDAEAKELGLDKAKEG